MYKYLLLFFFFLNVALCQGQNRLSKSIHFSYYIDSTAELTSTQVIHQDFFEVGPISFLLNKLDHRHVNWIKINAPQETLEYECEIKINGSFYDKVYEVTGQNLKEIKRVNEDAKNPYILSLSPFTDKQFLLKRKPIKSVFKKSTGIEIKRTRNKQGKMFEDGFIFITIFLSFFILIQFIFNRDKDFLLYFLYLFLTSCIYAHSSYFQEVDLTKVISNSDTTSLSYFLSPLALASYLIFVSSFLNIPKKLPKVALVFKFIFICIGIAMLGLLFINKDIIKVYFLTALCLLIFPALMYSFYHIFKLWNNKDWGTNLIITGSFVLFLAILISGIPFYNQLLGSIDPSNYLLNILKDDVMTHLNMFILKGAMLIEMLLYASALGIKRVNLERDKGQAEKQLLKKEIDTQKKEIALQQKIAEAEHKALKAQMNPHFMFNCLNSIKSLIQEKEEEKAEYYLVKFSELIRGIVDYSQETSITLDKELKFCTLYLEMEALRFSHSFDFKIEVNDLVDTSFYDVPPFLIQPILENSIKHGLIPKKDAKLLKILVYKGDGMIGCIIDDNGIGLEKAKKIAAGKLVEKKSIGIKNIKERLELFKDLHGREITFELIDKITPNGESDGVKAIISIPY